MPPAAFFVCGPTAVGKTGIAVALAERLGGEIVGADAMQIYAGAAVLAAHPSAQEQARAPHHLIGEVPAGESFDVAQYAARAREVIGEISARGRLPIVCGGSGLYIRAIMRGIADLPPADLALRGELEAVGLEALTSRLLALDPQAEQLVDLKNPRRVVRALEVCLLTGRPFTSHRGQWAGACDTTRGALLVRDREDLHSRIERRVEAMLAGGAIEEARALRAASRTARQMIGLREIEALERGDIGLPECRTQIAMATRRYAKRQLTWFRREPSLAQINLTAHSELSEVMDALASLSAGAPPLPA